MTDYPQSERKLIYRVLHAHLAEHPDLMDSEILHDLQRGLQQEAQTEGVDVADHGQWDAWLGNQPVACDVRVAKRTVIR